MVSTIARFDFRLNGGRATKTSPAILIVLKKWSEQEQIPCISAELMTAREIDEHVENLKADLDAVATRAKAALHAAS